MKSLWVSALRGCREQVVLATKFGNVRGQDGSFQGVNGKPQYVQSACDASLRRLGIDVIDLYYQHRVDPNTPIEDTVGCHGGSVREGKVRFLASLRPDREPFVAPRQCIPLRLCKPIIRFGPAILKTKFYRPFANWGLDSSHTAR